MNGRRVNFRHANVSANRIGLREIEEFLRRAAVACVDQISDIDVAARDDAAERRVDVLEGFELFEPAYVGFGRLQGVAFFAA